MRLSFEWAIIQGMKTTLNIAGERVTVTTFGDGASAAFDGMDSVVCDDMKLAVLDDKRFALSRSGVSLPSGDESSASLAHESRMSFGADSLAPRIVESRVPPYGGRRAAFDDASLEAPMYVNSHFSPEISARHRILPGTERSSGGRSQRSLPFGIRR